MALNIKSPEVDRLARELSALTGESITEAVQHALEERLTRARSSVQAFGRSAREVMLNSIFDRAGRMQKRDDRSDDELVGYGPSGAFE